MPLLQVLVWFCPRVLTQLLTLVALGPKAQAMSTYEECMALILAVTKWKPYLQHKEFTILTDHHSLIHLGDQKLMEGMQQKAFIKLLGLNTKSLTRKG